MTKISIELGYYPTDGDQLAVSHDEGLVRLEISGLKTKLVADGPGVGSDDDITLYPDEARALAAVLLAQADAAER